MKNLKILKPVVVGLMLALVANFAVAQNTKADKKLLEGVKTRNLELVQEALDEGANPEAKDKDGKTAVMLARGPSGSMNIFQHLANLVVAQNTEADEKLLEGAETGDLELVQEALDEGANTEAKDIEGSTALIVAAIWGNEDIVQLLIDREVDINAKDHYGRTAFVYADFLDREDIANRLVESGADTNIKVDWTPTYLY